MSTMVYVITGVSFFAQPFVEIQCKETSKLRVTGFCEGNPAVDFPHKGPVTRKMFSFDDVTMESRKVAILRSC